MLEAKQIFKQYKDLKVLKGIDLKVGTGTLLSLVGSSGAGKSTLLQILGTLDRPNQGELIIDNTNVFELNSNALAQFRNQNIGFVFQFHNLLPEFTALENVCIPAYIAKMDQKQAIKKATFLLERLGIADRATHKPDELSGGQRQRVAVARALINDPKIVFADEPSGNLDSENAQQLHELILDLKNELNVTFVIATHNQLFAKQSDRIHEIKDGLIVD